MYLYYIVDHYYPCLPVIKYVAWSVTGIIASKWEEATESMRTEMQRVSWLSILNWWGSMKVYFWILNSHMPAHSDVHGEVSSENRSYEVQWRGVARWDPKHSDYSGWPSLMADCFK
jgi:hypothetical protein